MCVNYFLRVRCCHGVYASMRTVTLFRTLSDTHLSHLISSGGSLVNLEPVNRDMKVRINVITHEFNSTSRQSKAYCLIVNGYHCMDVSCGILMAREMRSEWRGGWVATWLTLHQWF